MMILATCTARSVFGNKGVYMGKVKTMDILEPET